MYVHPATLEPDIGSVGSMAIVVMQGLGLVQGLGEGGSPKAPLSVPWVLSCWPSFGRRVEGRQLPPWEGLAWWEGLCREEGRPFFVFFLATKPETERGRGRGGEGKRENERGSKCARRDRVCSSDDLLPLYLWSRVLGRPWEQCWEKPSEVEGALTQSILALCCSLGSFICLPSNYSLSTYYGLSPRDNHEQGSDLLPLYIAHMSRAP